MKLHIAYIAGFLDADGSISASIVDGKNMRIRNAHLLTNVQFYGQNLSVITSIQETLECGKLYVHNTGQSGCYKLQIPRTEQVRVLKSLIPYLQIKREQAELVIQALSLTSRGSHKITDEVLERRRAIAIEISRLNKSDGKDYRTKWVNSVEPSIRVMRLETIPSQAATGTGDVIPFGVAEGVTTSRVSPNNNPDHEDPPRKG